MNTNKTGVDFLMSDTVYGLPTSIPDGDGFTLALSQESSFDRLTPPANTLKCRLAWIDAPEMSQDHGPESRAILFALIRGQELKCVVITHDKYRRYIVSVWLPDGRHLNRILLELGAAHFEKRFLRSPGYFAGLEAKAKAQGLGLWRNKHPEIPHDHRARRILCATYKTESAASATLAADSQGSNSARRKRLVP